MNVEETYVESIAKFKLSSIPSCTHMTLKIVGFEDTKGLHTLNDETEFFSNKSYFKIGEIGVRNQSA